MTMTLQRAKQLWRLSRAVCFDVDSTVVTEEGIDVLAEACGAGPAVAEWTRKAMGGSVPFHVALEARLNLFKPSRQDVQQCLDRHPLALTPGMPELMEKLHAKGKHVYLVSGGFRQMIHPVARVLNIPLERVYANNLLFDEKTGAYLGFDANEPTSRAGGKGVVVGKLKEQFGYDPIIMVGDGATDMEARPPASAFVGFGGIVVREAVKKGSDWYAMEVKELIDALD
jgi:phosphoserine phosphatase